MPALQLEQGVLQGVHTSGTCRPTARSMSSMCLAASAALSSRWSFVCEHNALRQARRGAQRSGAHERRGQGARRAGQARGAA